MASEIVRCRQEQFLTADTAAVHELQMDHIRSPQIAMRGSDGAIEGRQAYAGYGEKILIDGSYVPLTGYTGHVQADPTGLIYMRGRFYSPAWHSFVNSDQGVDPNSWNQKAYAGGSPFMATDPSGMRNSQPGARNSWAADWSRIFGFWLSDSYGINSAVVEVTDASPFPDYFDVGYSSPFGWGYDGSLFETGKGGGTTPVKQPQTPDPKLPCEVVKAMAQAVQASNSPNSTDKYGGLHEEGGIWGPNTSGGITVVPALPGPVYQPGAPTVSIDVGNAANSALLNSFTDLGGKYHIHPRGNRGFNFLQSPSTGDLSNPLLAPINVVVGAQNGTVYFYNASGVTGQVGLSDLLKRCK